MQVKYTSDNLHLFFRSAGFVLFSFFLSFFLSFFSFKVNDINIPVKDNIDLLVGNIDKNLQFNSHVKTFVQRSTIKLMYFPDFEK